MKNKNNTMNKYAALVTYVIAVVCLLLGLFLPLTSGKILALQLPEAFKAVSGKENSFILAYPVDLLGTGKFTVDITAWVLIVFAAVTALGLLALIPVFTSKRYSKTANVLAYIIETAAAAVITVYLLIALQHYPEEQLSYNMLIAFGGAALMLIIQSLIYKKGGGAAKVILFILSAASLFFLFDIVGIINQMHVTWPKAARALNSSAYLYGSATGIQFIRLLFEGPVGNNIVDAFNAAPAAKDKAALILTLALGLIVLFNYFSDLIGLSSNSKKAGHYFNCTRFTVEILVLVCLYITIAVSGQQFGLLLYLISAAAVIEFMISVVRAVRGKNKKPKLYTNTGSVPLLTPQSQPAVIAPAATAIPAETESSKKEKTARNAHSDDNSSPVYETRVYTVNTVYQGPSDEFLKKLTNDEKIEFAMTFIEKTKGDLGNIPDYVIGGNNKKFFSAVFIYLGKFRSLISDGLLNKMFKELNML